MAKKKPTSTKRPTTLKVVLEFSEADLNSMLEDATFGDDKPYTVEELKKVGRYREFCNEIRETADVFKDEIMDGTRDACANDWLNDFDRSMEDED